MNLIESPIPNGVESPFVYVVKPDNYPCFHCNSTNTYIECKGRYLIHCMCIDCKIPFVKAK